MTIQRILVAHDLSEPATRALRFAADLASLVGAALDVAYVHPDIYDGRGEPAFGLPATDPGQAERYLRFLTEELSRLVHEALADVPVPIQCHVLRGDPVKRLEALATEIGADVLCLGATGKGAMARVLLGSVSLLALRSASIPVLLVP